jgi:hypothetical protein
MLGAIDRVNLRQQYYGFFQRRRLKAATLHQSFETLHPNGKTQDE